jgi:hypothetical protein
MCYGICFTTNRSGVSSEHGSQAIAPHSLWTTTQCNKRIADFPMKKFVGYGVGPSCANVASRNYKLSLISVTRNKNCPGERAIIEVMMHEVIYPLTIPYSLVKEKVNNRIPHCPKIDKGNITKTNLQTDNKHTIHGMSYPVNTRATK